MCDVRLIDIARRDKINKYCEFKIEDILNIEKLIT